MLKLIENLNAETAQSLWKILPGDLVSSFTLFSLLDWYTVDGAWLQTNGGEITALAVEKESTKLYVTANDNADFCELAEFIKHLGGLVVNCPSAITKKLNVTPFSKLSVMSLCEEVKSGKEAITLNDDLRPVFKILTQSRNEIIKNGVSDIKLKKFNEKAYKEWLSKTSRGILNGYTVVKAVKAAENSVLSVAVADKLGDRVYIRDVATDLGFREMGYASDCVRALCAELKTDSNEIFLVCDDIKTENFYKRLGFERKDYIELGIVEL